VGLQACFAALLDQFELLSPVSVDFVDSSAPFVRLPHELRDSESDVEQRHLDALVNADFVWLHAPDGYIGSSAAFELGHAKSLGIPIFSDTSPAEDIYKAWVTVVASPGEVVVRQELCAPGRGLQSLQNYYERAARRRGWAGESAQDTLLLMTEEMGELARAVRKAAGLARHGDWDGQDVGEEMADIQLYLVHLANILGIDLADAVRGKEAINAERAARSDVA
jgi:NTP pyrophosphatase (non-canonical NTP hydrolase)